MKSILSTLVLSSFMLLSLSGNGQEVIPGELIISLEQTVQSKSWVKEFQEKRASQFAGEITQLTGYEDRVIAFEFDSKKMSFLEIQDALLNLEGVESVQPNYVLDFRTEPNDGFFFSQWTLETIQVEDVWETTTGGVTINGDTIVVAVIDSGFKVDHPDLKDNIWINWAEINGIPNFDDDGNGLKDDVNGYNFEANLPIHPVDSHGTAVAGIIGAKGNNNLGISGINWNVKLMVFTVYNSLDIIESYTHVLNMRKAYNDSDGEKGAYIVATNASLGINGAWCAEFPAWGNLYDPLGEAGVLNIAATANSNVDVDENGDMPTSCPSDYLLTVTNTSRDDTKVASAAFSNIHIDMGAPGGASDDGSFTLYVNDDYDESFAGTSAACPHVAGVAALLFSLPCEQIFDGTPGETALLIKEALMEAADPNPSLEGITVTGARLNASRSMAYIHSYCQPIKPVDFFEAFSSEKGFLQVSPSPLVAGDMLQVVYSNSEFGPIKFTLYDVYGRELYIQQEELIPFEDQAFEIPTANLAGGTYFLTIECGKDPITRKIMVID